MSSTRLYRKLDNTLNDCSLKTIKELFIQTDDEWAFSGTFLEFRERIEALNSLVDSTVRVKKINIIVPYPRASESNEIVYYRNMCYLRLYCVSQGWNLFQIIVDAQSVIADVTVGPLDSGSIKSLDKWDGLSMIKKEENLYWGIADV